MATEKLEDFSTEKLERRKRLMVGLIGVFIGVILIWITLIVIDLVQGRGLLLQNISGLLAPVGMIWIPVFMLKKVNAELDRRKII